MMYKTTDGRTWSSMVSSYRHEAAINPNPELIKYYAEEADKCVRRQSIANALYYQRQYPYAMLELVKAMAILEEVYDTVLFKYQIREVRQMENRFLEGLSQEDCDKAVRLISTMFRGVHNTPKKSVRTDHRIQYSA